MNDAPDHADRPFWHDLEADGTGGGDTDVPRPGAIRERYDVAIVGGGYAGLSTAIELVRAEPGIRVGVFERQWCGFGASGRNSGFLTPLVGHDLHTVHRRFGDERGRALVNTGRQAVAHVEALIDRLEGEHGADCQYEATGLAIPAVSGAQLRRMDQQRVAAERLGVPATTWNASTCAERLGVEFFRGALVQSDGGVLHPYRLARAMVTDALASGVELHEGVEVQEVLGADPGGSPSLRVGGRTICAEHVVLATNGYTRHRTLRRRFAPLHVYTLVTEPLDEAHKAALGPCSDRALGRVGFYTLHHILWALRWTADDRLLIATGDVKYHWRDRLHVASESTYAKLRRGLRWFHPTLADVEITHRWDGVIGVTLDDLPVIGETPDTPGVHQAIAFCGHGVALATWAGTLMRDMVLGRPLPEGVGAYVGGPRFPPVPGEPIRSPFAAAYIGLLRGLDAVANLGTPGRP